MTQTSLVNCPHPWLSLAAHNSEKRSSRLCTAWLEQKQQQKKKETVGSCTQYTQKYLHHITHHRLSLHNHNLLLCKCFFTTKRVWFRASKTSEYVLCIIHLKSYHLFVRLDREHHGDIQSKNKRWIFGKLFFQKAKKEKKRRVYKEGKKW